jgi:predicted RNA-binding protein with PUA-like domain
MHYWLLKTEPSTYSWDDLVRDKKAAWTGVRNFQARNNLRLAKVGDLALFYHSGDEKAVVGVAKIVKAAYADPTAKEGDWVAVDVAAVKACKKSVTLGDVKKSTALKKMVLANNSRLSVQPVTAAEWKAVLALAGTVA